MTHTLFPPLASLVAAAVFLAHSHDAPAQSIPSSASFSIPYQVLGAGGGRAQVSNVISDTVLGTFGGISKTVGGQFILSLGYPAQLIGDDDVDTMSRLVVGWGNNSSGQTNVPAGLSDVTAVAAGRNHSVALKSDKTVVAWGQGSLSSVPAGLSDVIAIGAGSQHTVALRSGGTVVVWGVNNFGLTNVPAGLNNNVTAIASGSDHIVARKNDGTVVAWGFNGSGETNVPAGLSGVTAIAADEGHSIALKSDGTVVTWGFNNSGQMNAPAGLNNVTAIAAGQYHSAALKTDGTVVVWGNNSFGETNVPASLSGVTAIAAGGNYTLALKADKTVVAWGKWSVSVAGQDPGLAIVPPGLSNVAAIAAGEFHALALVNARPPLLNAITPTEVLGGSGSPLTLNLQGFGFTPTSAVRWEAWDQTTTLATTFINNSALTAQIPASFLPEPLNGIQTAQIAVVNPLGGVSAPKAFTVKVSNVGAVQSKVAAPGEAVTVQTVPTAPNQAGLSASFVNNSGGSATVTAANYTSNPVAGTSIDTGGGIVDLQITGADASDTATVQFYYSSAVTGSAETNLVLRYFSGTVWVNLLSSGGVTPVKNTNDNQEGTVSGGRFTVLFDNSSTPKITELSGTVIAMSVNRAPVAQGKNVVVSAGSNCSTDASVNNGSFDMDDSDRVTVTQTPPGPYPVGVTQVILTVTDDHGATSSASRTVTVIDNTPPALMVPAAMVVSNDPGNCGAIVNFTVTAADNCSGVTVVSTPASGTTFPKGTTTVTSLATDASGNTTTKTFTVTVNDTEAPLLTVPSPIVVRAAAGRCDAAVTYAVTAADNCPGVTVVSTPASGSTFPLGTTTVTSIATDTSGNVTTKTFAVTVKENVEIGNAVVVARNSAWLKQKSVIHSGDVIVNGASSGPLLNDGVELSVGQNVTTPAGFALRANRISVRQKSTINSDVYFNELEDAQKSTLSCAQHTPLPLPVFCALPSFQSAPPGSQNIEPKQGETVTLNAGDYGDVILKQKGTLRFTGGTYNFRNLDIGQNVDVLFAAPSVVRIAERFALDQKSILGPDAGSGIGAKDIVLYVNGINGKDGKLNGNPDAAKIGENCVVRANVYAPNGTLFIHQKTSATGAFLARDVVVGENVELGLESAFGPAISGGAGLLSVRASEGEVQFAAPALPRLLVTAAAAVELQFTGTPGSIYTLEASQDLKTWEPLTEVQMGPEGLMRFTDPDSKNLKMRFYRLIPQQMDSRLRNAGPADR